MLLQRLDVTLASFVRSKQVSGSEDEYNAAVYSHRSLLRDTPRLFLVLCSFWFCRFILIVLHIPQLQDVLSAPESLIMARSQHLSAAVSYNSLGGGCMTSGKLVKSVLIGTVPDRGGRVDQIKPKSFDAPTDYRSTGR